MNVWSHLTEPNPSGATGESTGSIAVGTLFQNMSGMGGVTAADGAARKFVPLQFWFCRNPGLALPLIALQYHEVKVILDHQIVTVFGADPSLKLWVDYIYLDTDERRRFAQQSHEYLIEQLQYQTEGTAASKYKLNFNHPVKELIFCAGGTTNKLAVVKTGAVVGTARLGGATSLVADQLQLKLNGHDRFAARDYRYFTRTQVWQHHTGPGPHSL